LEQNLSNVNRRLLTWGAVFSGYPNLKIVHRAGRVHSNVDPISRLRRRIPYQDGPSIDPTGSLSLSPPENSWTPKNGDKSQSAIDYEDPLLNMYEELGERFEEKLLKVATQYVSSMEESWDSSISLGEIDIPLHDGNSTTLDYHSSESYTLLIGISQEEMQKWKDAYLLDPHFSKILQTLKEEKDVSQPTYPQYSITTVMKD
jgi:hypothetical protein